MLDQARAEGVMHDKDHSPAVYQGGTRGLAGPIGGLSTVVGAGVVAEAVRGDA